MRIVTVGGVRIGQEIRRDAFVERRPVRAAVGGFEHPADRDRQVQVPRIAWIDAHRMQQFAVRGAQAGRPFRVHGVVVESRDRLPMRAVVPGAKQPGRRAPGIPDPRLGGVPGREPEHALDGAGLLLFRHLAEGRWRQGLLPVPAAIDGGIDRGTQVPGLGRQHQASRFARVLHHMVNDMSEHLRPGEAPGAPARVGAQAEQALAGADPQGTGHMSLRIHAVADGCQVRPWNCRAASRAYSPSPWMSCA